MSKLLQEKKIGTHFPLKYLVRCKNFFLNYSILLTYCFINLTVESCENIVGEKIQWYISTIVCVARLNKCLEVLYGEVNILNYSAACLYPSRNVSQVWVHAHSHIC